MVAREYSLMPPHDGFTPRNLTIFRKRMLMLPKFRLRWDLYNISVDTISRNVTVMLRCLSVSTIFWNMCGRYEKVSETVVCSLA